MPRHNQEYQEPQRKRGPAASVGHVERLVIGDLASDARIVLASSRSPVASKELWQKQHQQRLLVALDH